MLFPLAIAFELLGCCAWVQEWYFIPHFRFSFLAVVDKAIHLTVLLIASIIFGFCIISYTELKSHLLTSFKSVVLVLKPYIIVYTFIFDRTYCDRILSPILCTLDKLDLIANYYPILKLASNITFTLTLHLNFPW